MNEQNRRAFLQASTVALASVLGRVAALGGSVTAHDLVSNLSAAQVAPTVPANEGRQPLRLGLILAIGRDPHDAIAKVHDLGFPTCQAFVDEIDSVLAGHLREALNKYQIEAEERRVGKECRSRWSPY